MDTAGRLNAKLADFARDTSNQVVVAIFPELPSASLEDFTVRTAQAWGAGNKKFDNGVVLFVFVKDRKVRIEVGYGLEGALPDVTAKRIIEEQIVPRFRAGDYAGGIEAGVDAVMAATRGEYQPPPAPASGTGSEWLCFLVSAIIIISFFFWGASRAAARRYEGRGRRSPVWWGGPWGGGWSSGGEGWSSGGGGSSSDSFSGGGGSFGGGGASGSW